MLRRPSLQKKQSPSSRMRRPDSRHNLAYHSRHGRSRLRPRWDAPRPAAPGPLCMPQSWGQWSKTRLMVAPKPRPKKPTLVRASLARGGSTSMAGRGDRTKTSDADAAGTQQPGGTAHKTPSRGSQLAEGGKQHMMGKQAADPARPGTTGKQKPAASPKQASPVGGMAFPAKPA